LQSKIIRVLNLWQKNNVFAPEVIQPLFDLANPDHPVHQNFMQQQQQSQNDISQNGGMNIVRESPLQKDDQNAEILNATNLQKFQFQQLMMQQQSAVDSAVAGASHDSVKFNKQLLEFDYGSDGDEDKTDMMQMQQYQVAMSSSAMPLPYQFSKVLEDPNILKQLQNIKNIDVQRYLNEMPGTAGVSNDMNTQPMHGSGLTLANINSLRGPQTINLIDNSKDQDVEFIGGGDAEVIPVSSRSPTPKHTSSKRRRSRSYSRERYGRRRRSRSRSRSTRSRSRSPRNRRRSSRDRPRDKEREKQREIEKERRRKGLPDIKKDHLSVCSTTLWVGHLSKLVQQEELSDTFGKYGDIISIDMIPPRGCAYIVMNRRQDAHKAMQQLKNHKMQNRTITISWAAGKGVKGKEWKDYFDQTLGVTYIPFSKLSHETDFVALEEGGMYDEETVPAWVKEKMKQPLQTMPAKDGLLMPPFFGLPTDVSAIDTSQPPPNAQTLMPAMQAFPLGARLLMPNVLPLGVPPPNMLSAMVFPTADKSLMSTPGLLGFPMAAAAAAAAASAQHLQQVAQSSGEDHMDIEMEDEHHTNALKDSMNDVSAFMQQAAFLNQPPPQLASLLQMQQQQQQSNNDLQNDEFNRVRNNRSQSQEKDRNDFRRGQIRGDRRSGQDNYNNRNNNRWSSNNDSSHSRDRSARGSDNRSRDGKRN
jgi:RNA-binding protein 16